MDRAKRSSVIRLTDTARARLDEVRELIRRPLSYARLIEELARDRLSELRRGDDDAGQPVSR